MRALTVAEFDAAAPADAAAELLPCCASRRWIGQLVQGRPYVSVSALSAASDAVLARLDWPDLSDALAAHPRIGAPAADAGREWSRAEAAGTAQLAERTRTALEQASLAYEQHFGHAFIFATGLSAEQLLTSLRTRLRNDPVAEREIVRSELTKIVRSRLARTFR